MKQGYTLSVVIRLLAIVISSAGSLLIIPLILERLGEYDLGIWGIVSAITAYLLLLDFGIALACTRYLSLQADDKKQWTKIISNSLAPSFVICGLLLIIALLIVQFEWTDEKHQLINNIVCIIIVEVAISIPLSLYISVLRTEVRYVDIGIFEVIRVSLRIGSIILALLAGADLLDIVIISSLVNLAFFLLPVISVWIRHKTLFFSAASLRRSFTIELLHFSKFAAISQTADFLKFRTDSVLVAILLSVTAAAHYTIIMFIVLMLTQILMRFLSYWDTIIIRYVGEKNDRAAIDTLLSVFKSGLTISILSLVNTIIFGELFISLWVGDEYAFLHFDLILLTLVLMTMSIQMPATAYLNAINRQKVNANLDLAEIISKFILIAPFTWLFGLSGFIAAIIFSSWGISIVARVYLISGYTRQPVRNMAITIIKSINKPLFTGLTIVSTYLILKQVLSLSLIHSAVITGVTELVLLFYVYGRQIKFRSPTSILNTQSPP